VPRPSRARSSSAAPAAGRRRRTGAIPTRRRPKAPDAGRRRAFELTRQALGYRQLQLLALPLETMDREALQSALAEIGNS